LIRCHISPSQITVSGNKEKRLDLNQGYLLSPSQYWKQLYRTLNGHAMGPFIPHDVLSRVIHGASVVRAWREHFGLSQMELAQRMGIPGKEFALQEANDSWWRPLQARIAAALGIDPEQLDI
jgi:hypothetical protein